MAVIYGARPAALDGCWRTWTEQDKPTVLRTDMDSGDVKVRRRVTGVGRTAEVSVLLAASKYDAFMEWYRVRSQGGALPTAMVEPSGKEAVWRFVEPPRITWPEADNTHFQATCRIERLPTYQDL